MNPDSEIATQKDAVQAHTDADQIRNHWFTHKYVRMVQIGDHGKPQGRVGDPDLHELALFLEAGSGSAFKSKLRSFRGTTNIGTNKAEDANNGGLESQNEPRKVYRPRLGSRIRIRIRIKVPNWIHQPRTTNFYLEQQVLDCLWRTACRR
jgi:hypothetical protein